MCSFGPVKIRENDKGKEEDKRKRTCKTRQDENKDRNPSEKNKEIGHL